MSDMPTSLRYWLFQIPGAVCAALALYWLSKNGWIDQRWVSLGLIAWIIKDAALYPLTREAYEIRSIDHQAPVGETGVVKQPLCPDGTVAIRGTIWQAQLAERGNTATTGTAVKVTKRQGLRLTVIPAEEEGIS